MITESDRIKAEQIAEDVLDLHRPDTQPKLNVYDAHAAKVSIDLDQYVGQPDWKLKYEELERKHNKLRQFVGELHKNIAGAIGHI